MSDFSLKERLAVCSWSLQPESAQDLVEKVGRTGLRRVQLALGPLADAKALWGGAGEVLAQNGIEVVSGMLDFPGEDYTSLESIRLTGGIAPDPAWPENWERAQAVGEVAKQLGLRLVTFHAGFLPHETADPESAKMRARLVQMADAFAARGIELALETGQETAPVLAAYLRELGCANLGVNFDPANMILYDKGEPLEALELLGPWIRQVHIKDAVRAKVSGAWGEEVPVGDGSVSWREFFRRLERQRFEGNLVIEREAGSQRIADVRKAKELVEKECAQLDRPNL